MTARDRPRDTAGGTALRDAVTGALSRAFFEVRLREEVSRAGRSGAEFAVCLFDVDHFKSVNDAFGHPRGDQVLRDLVTRIGESLRGADAVFRYGGDEFVLLLPDAGRAEAAEVALRVTDEVGGKGFAGDPPLRVGISLGVACFPADARDGPALVAVADRRSYLAKRRGRGCAAVDDEAGGGAAAGARLLERDAETTAMQGFLVGLTAGGPGTLRVGGERGGGQSRFLDEIAKIAELRGFEVRWAGGRGLPAETPDAPAGTAEGAKTAARQMGAPGSGHGLDTGVLVIADGEGAWSTACRLARDSLHTAPTVGLVLAAPGRAVRSTADGLPLRGVVELTPWSAAAVRVWLRTRLSGEPGSELVNFVFDRSGGLPARAERCLGRLLDADALQRDATGWALAAPVVQEWVRRPLPLPPTALVGRGPEIDQLIAALTAERLVTLAGPGGIGKTRLALAVAAAAEDRFADGAVFVGLAAATTAEHVDSAVAEALGVAPTVERPLAHAVAERLSSRELLLVLDNFEQVHAASERVAAWLAAADGLTVLVTSRERLRLPAERVYLVPGLTLPELASLHRDADAVAVAVAQSSALDLLTTRAQRIAYDFTLSPHDLPAAAELCHRLDGIPLAIELAAAHLDTMSPQELLSRLTERLDLLGEGPVDVPVRQQTLRGAIDWSYDLLGRADRELFAALGVFAGGCRIEGAEAVITASRCVDRLAGLVDKNLLQVTADPDGGRRFVMLETIHAYAAEQLAVDPGADSVHARHAAYCGAVAAEVGGRLVGPEQSAALERIAGEQHNMRSALTWTLDNGDYEIAARISLGIWRYWASCGHASEGREWITRILSRQDLLPPAMLASLLYAAGSTASRQGDARAAEPLLEQSLVCARVSDERRVMVQALRMLGEIRAMTGDYEHACRLHRESLALARAESDQLGIAYALGDLGDIAIRVGDLAEAGALVSESLRLFRAIGHTNAALTCMLSLGEVLLCQEDPAGARPLFEEGLVLGREIGDTSAEAWAMHHLGVVSDLEGDRAGARRHFASALSLRHRTEERPGIADSLEGLAGVTIADDPARSARLFGAAEALRERHQLARPPVWQDRWDAHMSELRDRLDADTDKDNWTSGRTTPLDDVVVAALEAGCSTGQSGGVTTPVSARFGDRADVPTARSPECSLAPMPAGGRSLPREPR